MVTLNPFCGRGAASAIARSMTGVSASRVSGVPGSSASAPASRHGRWATEPSATRAAAMLVPAGQPYRRRGGHQRVLVGRPLADLDIGLPVGAGRQPVAGDQLIRSEPVLAHRLAEDRRLALGQVELAHRDRPRPGRTQHLGPRVQRGEGDRRVGRLHRNAVRRPAEDRLALVPAGQGRAAAARIALVARPRQRFLGAEVRAAGALQHVAADRGPVPHLGRGRLQAGRGERAGHLGDQRVLADLVQRGQRADAQVVPVPVDAAQLVEAADVDHAVRRGDAQAEPVEQLGAARDHRGPRVAQRPHRRLGGAGSRVGKIPHRCPCPCAAASTAAVICG